MALTAHVRSTFGFEGKMVDEQKRGMKAAIKAAIGRDSYAEYMDVSAAHLWPAHAHHTHVS